MLKYFDDFVGKDLGPEVFAELIMYFSVNMMPVAIPLGVLLSSLMTFGNLGEHFELTAIKSAGISLIRALMPIGVFVSILTVATFFFNNHVVPAANLKAYSLLYDIKNTKPALDIRAGQFYNGIDGYSIKAKEKFPDNRTLKDVIIYDHSQPVKSGNNTVIIADSAIMYTVYNDRYLKFELYTGNFYDENPKGPRRKRLNSRYIRNSFDKMEMMFSLASFDLKNTKEELFQNNRQMKNISELTNDIDSLQNRIDESINNLAYGALAYYQFHFRDELLRMRDSIEQMVLIENERKERERIEKKNREEAELEEKEQERDSLRLIEIDTNEVEIKTNNELGNKIKASVINLDFLFQDTVKQKNKILTGRRVMKLDTLKVKKPDLQPEDQKYIERSVKPKEKYLKSPNNTLFVDTSEYARSFQTGTEDQEGAPEEVRSGIKKSTLVSDKNQEPPKFIKRKIVLDTTLVSATEDSIASYFEKYKYKKGDVVTNALSKVKNIRNSVNAVDRRVSSDRKNIDKYSVEKYKKYSQAFACFVMFLIGAPLGSIIKKGGLGVPVIVSIFFFIIYYVFTITSEKWAKGGLVEPKLAVWYANIILMPFGIYFLSRAKVDARLFELDSYKIWFQKRFRKRKN